MYKQVSYVGALTAPNEGSNQGGSRTDKTVYPPGSKSFLGEAAEDSEEEVSMVCMCVCVYACMYVGD